MNINTITLTGADNKVNKETLIEISNKYRNKYKYVEFGILFSLERQGHNRFPSLSWIKSLPFELRLSGHLCGTYAKRARPSL